MATLRFSKWFNTRRACLGSLSLIALSGCGLLSDILPDNTSSLPPLPPEQYLADSPTSVHESDLLGDPLAVVLGVDVVHRDGLDLQLAVREGLYKILSESRVNVTKVGESSYTEPFRDAIEWSQFNSVDGAYLGEQKINYILSGSLEVSRFEKRFKKKPRLCTIFSDNCKAACKFEAQATLSIEAEALPAKRRSKKWVLASSESVEFKVDSIDCPAHNAPGKPWQQYQKVRDNVIDDLLDCSRKPLQDFLSSRGYIKSYHSDGQNFFFTMSSGYAAGFSKGDTVTIERLSEGEFRNEAQQVAEGKITYVGERLGYISVSSQEIASQILKNDRVRLVRKKILPEVKCKLVRK